MVVDFIDFGDLESEAPRHRAQVRMQSVHARSVGLSENAHVELTPA
jgi:hypothetical protein